jgi:hypothetical protein
MRDDLIGWQSDTAEHFGSKPLQLGHTLHQSPLFTESALARLIEGVSRENYYVNTMDVTKHNIRSRREGAIVGITGQQVLEAVRTGQIWILIQNPDHVDPAYGELLESLYREMAERVPGFRPSRKKMTVLISSPNIQVYYHCDVPGQTLWQVKGNKSVFVYPNHAPYLEQAALERIVLGEAHEISLKYDPAFDKDAIVYDLQPGQMLHWPLNAPHRIVNADCVNVSFTTEHFTPDIRRTYFVNYANGLLRNRLGMTNLSQTTAGPTYWSKFLVGAAYKASGAKKKRSQVFKIDFAVDPTAPRGVRTIPSYEFRK